jgi:hypothetical protein
MRGKLLLAMFVCIALLATPALAYDVSIGPPHFYKLEIIKPKNGQVLPSEKVDVKFVLKRGWYRYDSHRYPHYYAKVYLDGKFVKLVPMRIVKSGHAEYIVAVGECTIHAKSGKHTLRVDAYENWFKVATDSVTFYVKAIPTTVKIVKPKNGATVSPGYLEVVAVGHSVTKYGLRADIVVKQGTHTKVFPARVIPSPWIESFTVKGKIKLEAQPNLAKITVRVKNWMGHVIATDTITVKVKEAYPTVKIVYPKDGSTVRPSFGVYATGENIDRHSYATIIVESKNFERTFPAHIYVDSMGIAHIWGYVHVPPTFSETSARVTVLVQTPHGSTSDTVKVTIAPYPPQPIPIMH